MSSERNERVGSGRASLRSVPCRHNDAARVAIPHAKHLLAIVALKTLSVRQAEELVEALH